VNAEEWLNGSGELTDSQVNEDQFREALEHALKSPAKAWKALGSRKHREAIRKLGIKERAVRDTVSATVREFGSRLSKLQSIDGFHASLLGVAAAAVEIDGDSRRRSQYPFLTETELKVLVEASIANDFSPIPSKFDARKFLSKLLAPGVLRQIRMPQAGRGDPILPMLLGQCISRALDGRSPTVGGRLALGALMMEGEGIEADERERLDKLGMTWEERTQIVEEEIPSGNFDFLLRESPIEDIESVLSEQEDLSRHLVKLGLGIDVKLERRRRLLRDLAVRLEDPWVLWTYECLRGGDEALMCKAVEGLERIAQAKGVRLNWANAPGLASGALWQRADHVPVWIGEARANHILEAEFKDNERSASAVGWIRFGIVRLACLEGEVRALSCLDSLGIQGKELMEAREACGRGVDQFLRGKADLDWSALARSWIESRSVVAELKLPAAASASIKDALCKNVAEERDSLARDLQVDGLSFFASHAYRCFERRIQGAPATESEAHLISILLDGDAQAIRELDGKALVEIAERDGSPEATQFLVDRFKVHKQKVLKQWQQAGHDPNDIRAQLEKDEAAIIEGRRPEGDMADALRSGDAKQLLESAPVDDGMPDPPVKPARSLDRYLRTRILAGALLVISLLWLTVTYVGGNVAADDSALAVAEPIDSTSRPALVAGLRPLPGASDLWYSDLVSGDQMSALLPVAATGRAPAAVDALTAARWCKLWAEVSRAEIQSLVDSGSARADWVARLPSEAELRLLVAAGVPLGNGAIQGEWLSQTSATEAQSNVSAWVQNAPTTVYWSAPRVGFRCVVARNAGARP